MRIIIFSLFCLLTQLSFGQIDYDSVQIYYGMTQKNPDKPLEAYFSSLEKSGAKLQTLKKDTQDKLKGYLSNSESKKYKKGKHKNTVYFFIGYKDGKKEKFAIESATDYGLMINLETGTQFFIKDLKKADVLYYLLLAIH